MDIVDTGLLNDSAGNKGEDMSLDITLNATRLTEVYSANITHNLARMAEEAGIYKHLWRPKEIGITRAVELIEPLRFGLSKMKADPERFKKFDAENGWGTYEQFLPWIEEYVKACEASPDADISVSR